MEAQAIASQQSASGATPALGVAKDPADAPNVNGVDFQNFLTLLTAQLRNQDPLSPADSTEFVAQLASFSSVEQLVRANGQLETIASAITGGGIDQYADWIGRSAEAPGGSVYFSGEPVRFRLTGEPSATRAEAIIFDPSGIEVARFDVAIGRQVQTWDGQVDGNAVENGVYKVTAAYYNDEGLIRTDTANTFGVVNEIRLDGGAASLRLEGDIEVDPSDVVALSAAL
jgi:flagellar basal-body rod modification protein FlgD